MVWRAACGCGVQCGCVCCTGHVDRREESGDECAREAPRALRAIGDIVEGGEEEHLPGGEERGCGEEGACDEEAEAGEGRCCAQRRLAA